MIWVISTLILLVLFCGMTFVAYRFFRRAAQYDEVFQFLVDDIDTNLKQFLKMQSMQLISNEPEVTQAHKNMLVMAKRLEEILVRIESVSGLDLRAPPPPQPPKYTDR